MTISLHEITGPKFEPRDVWVGAYFEPNHYWRRQVTGPLGQEQRLKIFIGRMETERD